MNEQEKLAKAMIKAANKMLDDSKSIHAPCENAYKDGRDGRSSSCPCWRCREEGSNSWC